MQAFAPEPLMLVVLKPLFDNRVAKMLEKARENI